MTEGRKDLALDLLEMALAHRGEADVLATALIALDRLVQRRPEHASAHYAAGRILLLRGQSQLAMGAFRLATTHAPRDALAHYYEGVCHWLLGDDQAALTKMARARALDRELAPAFFDAAQIHTARGDHRGAVRLLERALALAPDDFLTLRKCLATQIALGRWEAARVTHERVHEIWARTEDPRVRALRSFVLDRFDVGATHVIAVETFAVSDDPGVKYTFAITVEGATVASVNLETSAALRESGYAWALTLCDGDVRVSTGAHYRSLPAYPALRRDAIRAIERVARTLERQAPEEVEP